MSGSAGNIYDPSATQQSGQNTNALGLLNQSTGGATGYAPAVQAQATGLTQNYINNPYQAQAQSGAGGASTYATGTLTPQLQGGATDLSGLGKINSSYVPQALSAGFDPQNATYNRDYQRAIDQQNSINAQSGVSNTPYGAGVTGQVANNFNLDWLDRALGRQSTAAGTASTLSGAAGNAYTAGGNVGGTAVNTQVGGSALPASTYGQNLAQDIAALSGQNTAVSGASGVTDQALQDILAYLGYGTSAGAASAKAQSDTFQGIGSIIGAINPFGSKK